jgi:hypothetical protein
MQVGYIGKMLECSVRWEREMSLEREGDVMACE